MGEVMVSPEQPIEWGPHSSKKVLGYEGFFLPRTILRLNSNDLAKRVKIMEINLRKKGKRKYFITIASPHFTS